MNKSHLLLLGLLFFISSPLFTAENPDPHRFDEAISSFQQWDSKNAVPDHHILFVGSSSIHMWKTAEAFSDLPVVNRGFGGAQISDMLFFKQDIMLKYGAPEAIIMYCGGNDIAWEKSAEQVIGDFKAWWGIVHTQYPATPLIYIPIKPCPNRWDLWQEESNVNNAIQKMCENHPLLFYADIATPMLETGTPPADDLFIEDQLHLSEKGYKMWNDVVREILDDILN